MSPARARVCVCAQQKSYTHVKDPVVQIEVGGLWKRQNNPACTKSVSVEVEHQRSYSYTACTIFALAIRSLTIPKKEEASSTSHPMHALSLLQLYDLDYPKESGSVFSIPPHAAAADSSQAWLRSAQFLSISKELLPLYLRLGRARIVERQWPKCMLLPWLN